MYSLKQGGGQGRSEQETSSLSKRITAPDMWKKARVEELKVGSDGATRTAVFRGANGTVLVRPIQLVIPLEVDQGGEDVEDP